MWQFFNNKEFLADYKIIPFSLYKLACLKTQQPDLRGTNRCVFSCSLRVWSDRCLEGISHSTDKSEMVTVP